MQYKDYYKILGVDRKATLEDIQKEYKKLARKYHPDLNPDDKSAEDKFKDIGEAYEVLKDPEKRAQYDALGSSWKDGQRFTPPPGWQNINFGGNGVHFNMGGMGDVSDFFQTLFGGGMGGFGGNANFGNAGFSSSPRSQSSDPLELNLHVTELLTQEPVSISLRTPDGVRDIKVKIPRGVKNKSVFRLRGQGPHGEDLRVKIHLQVGQDCEITDHNITQKLKLTPWEAALGGPVDMETVAGSIKLSIPSGIQTGNKLRIAGKGLPKKVGMGDLFAEVQIVVPKSLTDEEKKLFEELAAISTFKARE